MTFTELNFMKLKGANSSLGCNAVWFSKQVATFNQDVTLQFSRQVETFH